MSVNWFTKMQGRLEISINIPYIHIFLFSMVTLKTLEGPMSVEGNMKKDSSKTTAACNKRDIQ